jgi:hypothetical protein
MNERRYPKIRSVTSVALLALLAAANSASATLVITTDNQQSTASSFTPSWPIDSATSLINGMLPSSHTGDYTGGGFANSSAALLTDGSAIIAGSPGYTSFVAGGGGGGAQQIVYTLPPATYGYNLTNIAVYTGWVDNGRDAARFIVLYSTVSNPTVFIPLSYANYNPSVPAGTKSSNRVVYKDSANSFIAANVAAVMFDFTTPNAENGWAGVNEITIGGTAATGTTNLPLSITYSNQNPAAGTTPSWTLETDSLLPAATLTTGGGDFAKYGIGSPGVSALTDGTLGIIDQGSSYATCGTGDAAGASVTYTFTNANGIDLTNVVVYSGWANNGRDGQFYNVLYSTVSAPTAFIPIATIFYNPITGSPSANRVAIQTSTGSPLAKNVGSLQIDFSPQANNVESGASLYSEIIAEGTNSAPPTTGPSPYLTEDTLPAYAETVLGDSVVFTAAYSNSPPASLQWQVIKAGVTNDVPGATTPTLTLNHLQVADSGFYMLKATNSTDSTALPSFSTPRQLSVSNSPAAVNNVIVNFAGQSFPSSSTNFFPVWPVDTNSLIYGFTLGSGPGTFTSVGDFTGGGNYCNADPTILSDGAAGSLTSLPSLVVVAGGPTIFSVGSSVTYTLITNSAPNGYDLTNITVFGGWQDGGRDEQKYQILYATASAPASFVPLVTADYNPTDPGNRPSVSRTTLIPAAGVLAHNVVAVKLNFDVSPAPENGWEGYSEFVVQGSPSLGVAPNVVQDTAPTTASDILGGQIVMSAVFSNYTSLQWQKNGTNISGATTSMLTLNNLSSNDAAAYTLVASNPFGSASSSACVVNVNPVPTAVSNVLTAIATQTSDAQVFTPTWNTNALGLSLLAGVAPTSVGPGDFTGGTFSPAPPTACSDPSILTDGSFGTADFYLTTMHLCWTAMGTGTGPSSSIGGQSVTYTLPPSANGYTITNIMTAGGWNDGGRDQQSYTVFYSTLQNPDIFLPIATVSYNPSNPAGYSVNRITLTPASGALATNVMALKFDMNFPRGENGFSGYSEFAVYGSPSATPPPALAVITAQNEQAGFDYVVETNNLIANQLPSSTGPGAFTEEGCNETNLTDGVIGFGFQYGASCGDDGIAVPWIVFNSASGWNLTNIVVYSLWHDYGRDGQFYNVSYSTLSAPGTFLPLASVFYNPDVPEDGTASGNRVAISPMAGQSMLASNVYAVKFDFTAQGIQDYAWSGYSEIVLQGSNLASPPRPVVYPVTLSGGNLILTGSGAPNYSYTVLTTTNLTTPMANWTVYTNAATDGAGGISNAIPIIPSRPASFFRVRMP